MIKNGNGRSISENDTGYVRITVLYTRVVPCLILILHYL